MFAAMVLDTGQEVQTTKQRFEWRASSVKMIHFWLQLGKLRSGSNVKFGPNKAIITSTRLNPKMQAIVIPNTQDPRS